MNVAVIPARGGSKRIPRKNIRKFCGKPMISWPISIAKESGLFEHIIVSTDDEEIADISRSYGAETPFMRPKDLADDHSDISGVIAHAVSYMHDNRLKPSAVCCIYPTSVFLTINDLRKGLDILNTGRWSYSFSVTEFEYPIFRSFKESPNGGVEMFFPEYYKARSQDLPDALHDAAQFYWGNADAWLDHLILFGQHSFPVVIPRWRVQDIDTKDDLRRAEILFNSLKQ